MFLVGIHFLEFQLYSSVGCMDTSLHAYLCNDEKLCELQPYDNKTLHYVHCTCPCNQYAWADRKVTCLRCWHFHDPRYAQHETNIVDFKYADEVMIRVLNT